MAVAASTVPVEVYARDGVTVTLAITASETIYKGDMVRIVAAGTATSTTAPATLDIFAGVAMETVTQSSATPTVRVYTTGVFSFALQEAGSAHTPAQTDVGCLAYQQSSNAGVPNQRAVGVAAETGTHNDLIVGAVVAIDPEAPTTNVLVKIQTGLNLSIA